MNAQPAAIPLSLRERWALAAILLLAAALRLIDLAFHAYAPDQSYSVDLAKMTWAGLLRETAIDTHPPLYYALLKAWFWLTPDTLPWAQGLSVLFALGTLAVVFRLGRDLFSPAAGWLALACMALAPYQIYWQHSARNHQLQPLAVGLIVWFSYRYLARPAWGLWWALAAAWALALHANYMALIVGLVWGVAFLFAQRAPWSIKTRLALAPLAGLLAFAPWLPVLVHQMRTGPANHNFFQETVSPIYFYYHALFGVMTPYQPNQSGLAFLVLLSIFTLVFAAGMPAVGRRWSYWILLLGLPTVSIAVAKLAGWTLAERHLYYCLPLFFPYWGAGMTEAVHRVRARLGRPRGSDGTENSNKANLPLA
jgi:uncharacterized membrane protein